MPGSSYLYRMPTGIAGGVTRSQDLTIEPVTLDYKNQFAAYGMAGKYDNNKFVPLEDGDDIGQVKGILVRPYPTTYFADLAYIGVTVNQTADNLKRGYICVQTTVGDPTTAKKGDPVYVRVAGGSEASPVGSFILTPDSTPANTPQLLIAEVMGPGQADGLVEIAYNI